MIFSIVLLLLQLVLETNFLSPFFLFIRCLLYFVAVKYKNKRVRKQEAVQVFMGQQQVKGRGALIYFV